MAAHCSGVLLGCWKWSEAFTKAYIWSHQCNLIFSHASEACSTSVECLSSFSPPDTAGTAQLCEMVDSFFDCLNVRSTSKHQRKRKPFLAPYTSLNDRRFHWLETTFLGYLRDWLQSTKDRPGDFTANARSKMFLSWQTYEGLQVTVHSVIEATRFVCW